MQPTTPHIVGSEHLGNIIAGATSSTPSMPSIPLLQPHTRHTPASITNSNDYTDIHPSIRCDRASLDDNQPLGSIPESSTSTRKRKTRGPNRGEGVLKHVAAHGRIHVVYQEDMMVGNKEVHDQLVRAIGIFIRNNAPMTVPCYGKLPKEFTSDLYNHLSTNFVINYEDENLRKYLDIMAKDRFREWKCECRKMWKRRGDVVMPKEFLERIDEWEWLASHFNDEESKKKSVEMTKARQSENKKNHTSGSTRFSHRAEKKKKEGFKAPHLANFIDVYKKNDPETVDRVKQQMNMAVDFFEETQPPQPEASSDGATQSFIIPIESEIEIIMGVRPQRQGTTVTGFGSAVHRPPKKRGGPRSNRDELEEVKRLLKENEEVQYQKDEAHKMELEAHKKQIEAMKIENAEREERDRKRHEELLNRLELVLAGHQTPAANLTSNS